MTAPTVRETPAELDLGYFDAYVQRLAAADWAYEHADDPRAFKAGQAQVQALRAESATHPVLADLFRAAASQPVSVSMPFLDYAAWRRRELARVDAPRSDVQRLARAVRQLSTALAMAAPDNALPGRAMQLLNELKML